MKTCLGVAFIALMPAFSLAQEGESLSAWQVEKCRIYEQSWEQALEGFGADNLNYNFVAQNENFLTSGCVSAPAVCPQSSTEIQIADFLTIAMMNAGAASTFLPFRCEQ